MTTAHTVSRTFTALVAIAALIALLGACSGGPTPTVAVNPATVTVVPGGSATVTVTLTRAGTTSDVSLTASATPGLTFTFSPAVLSGSETTSTLTITAAAAGPEGTSPVTVTASGAGVTASTSIDVTVQLMTVTGTVYGYLGEPYAGATVYIEGHAPTTSLADGSFSVDGVSIPYDLTVAYTPELLNSYLGLSTSTADVLSYVSVLAPLDVPTATVSGTFTGAFSPIPANHVLMICPEGIDTVVYANPTCQSATTGETSYTLDLRWVGDSDAEVRLRAYLYQMSGDGEIVDVVAAATETIDVTDAGVHVKDIAPVAADPALVDIELEVGAPAGATVAYTIVTSMANGRSFLTPYSEIVSSPTHALGVQFAGASYTVLAQASAPAGLAAVWRHGLTNGDEWSAVVPQVPATLSPLDGATGIDQDSTFAVSTAAGGSSHFVLTSSTPGAPTWIVSTIETSMTLPDLTGIGFSLPSGHAFSYQVLVTPQTATADGMVTGGGYLGPYHELVLASQGGAPPTQDGSILIATGGTITTD